MKTSKENIPDPKENSRNNKGNIIILFRRRKSDRGASKNVKK